MASDQRPVSRSAPNVVHRLRRPAGINGQACASRNLADVLRFGERRGCRLLGNLVVMAFHGSRELPVGRSKAAGISAKRFKALPRALQMLTVSDAGGIKSAASARTKDQRTNDLRRRAAGEFAARKPYIQAASPPAWERAAWTVERTGECLTGGMAATRRWRSAARPLRRWRRSCPCWRCRGRRWRRLACCKRRSPC